MTSYLSVRHLTILDNLAPLIYGLDDAPAREPDAMGPLMDRALGSTLSSEEATLLPLADVANLVSRGVVIPRA